MAAFGVNPLLLPLLANIKELVTDVYVVRYVTSTYNLQSPYLHFALRALSARLFHFRGSDTNFGAVSSLALLAGDRAG